MNKVVSSAEEAIQDIFEGATIMVGRLRAVGMPENLIRALAAKGAKNLTPSATTWASTASAWG